jgi:hypothetical protein
MRAWLTWLLVAAGLMVASWALLVLLEAWPGDPRLLERLLGRARQPG